MRNSLQASKIKKIVDFVTFPIRLFLVLLVTTIDSILAIFGTFLFPRWYRTLFHYRQWAKRILFCSGIKVSVKGIENIEVSKSYVFVANHSSYFDIPAVFVAIPNRLRIMYKKELEKIPIFGWYLKYSDFIGIEREEIGSARKSLEEALKLIQQEISVLIFPEGTRSKDGTLGDFKRGALYLAIKSGKQIVPVTIIGARDILPRGSFFFSTGTIEVIVGKPFINLSETRKTEMDRLKKFLFQEIQSNLSERKIT